MRQTTFPETTVEHRILESGINTADLEVKWQQLLLTAEVVNHILYQNMLRGVFSWDDPADHDAVKLKLITTIAGM